MLRALTALVVTAVVVVALASYDTHPPPKPRDRPARHAKPAPRPSLPPGTTMGLGTQIHTPFSIIQVRATLARGRLTHVDTISLSSYDQHTRDLNARAEPILRREALRAGSAKIHSVSGATETSESWKQSLQVAIEAARG